MPIYPAVVVVPFGSQTAAAITTIANSITLTPGTLTMDYDEETTRSTSTASTATTSSRSSRPIRRWEDYALVIFDEEGNRATRSASYRSHASATDRGTCRVATEPAASC